MKLNTAQSSRRDFIKTALASVPLVAATDPILIREEETSAGVKPTSHIRLSCNLYSFNEPLTTGKMTLEEVIAFCADLGFDAVDPTGYYFPRYPNLPDDSFLYQIKRKAFRLGLDISGTGVRNDFTLPDPIRRKAEIELVKNWVGVAARIGAPVLRVFAGLGKELPAHYIRADVTTWVVDALHECAEYGAKQGVTIVLQNHADFIQSADQVLEIVQRVNSEWLAVNLDIGSFKIGDPFPQIARVAPFAATWQIKENLFVNGQETTTELTKIIQIVRDSGYRGYLPIETLGKGDPKQKVAVFYDKVKKALEATR